MGSVLPHFKAWLLGITSDELTVVSPAQGSAQVKTNELKEALGVYSQSVKTTTTLNIRYLPSTRSSIIGILDPGSIVPITGAEENGFLKCAGAGWIAKSYTVPYLPVDTPADPPVAVDPPPTAIQWTPKFSETSRGVHASAGGWAPDDKQLDLIRRNGVETVFIVCYEPGQADLAIKRFRSAGVKNFVFRAAIHESIGDPIRFINITLPILREYAAALGSTDGMMIQVHNEPNLTTEGLYSGWSNGVDYAKWFMSVAAAYRTSLPGCKIGFSPMSPGGAIQNLRYDEKQFVKEASQAVDYSDWVAVHCYWATPTAGDLVIPTGQWRKQFPGKYLVGTEVGPADVAYSTPDAVRWAYHCFAIAGVPAMIWLLNGAGSWPNVAWDSKNIYL